MSQTPQNQPDVEELANLFYAAQSRAATGQTPDAEVSAGLDDAALSHSEMVEEAMAIEAAWLAGRVTAAQPEPAEPVLSNEEMLDEAIAIEAAWLETRAPVSEDQPVEVAAIVVGEPTAEVEAPQEELIQAQAVEAGDDSGRGGGGGRWLRRAWTVASWAGVSIVAVLVILISAAIIVPKAMGWTGMVVLSGSMEPTLPVGGLAFMQPLDAGDSVDAIEPGDIITFRVEGLNAYISHRVVEVNTDSNGVSFVTKGDANDTPDSEPIVADRVVGVVRYHVPYLGRVVEKLQDRRTYYLFVGIPAGLLILTELLSVGREISTYYRSKQNESGAPS